MVSLCAFPIVGRSQEKPAATESKKSPAEIESETARLRQAVIDSGPTYDWVMINSGEWLRGRIKFMLDEKLEFDSDELDLQTYYFAHTFNIEAACYRAAHNRRIRTLSFELINNTIDHTDDFHVVQIGWDQSNGSEREQSHERNQDHQAQHRHALLPPRRITQQACL
jgi:hypothetical protein